MGRRTYIARPTAMLPALLLAYDKLGIANVADECMRDLDHANLNIYVPETHFDFALERIETGQNHSFQIGYNVWCVDHLRNEWIGITRTLSQDASLDLPEARAGALFSSLLMPDRQPWFLLLDSRC